MPAQKEYNSDQVNISIAGFPIVGGYADGVFLEMEFVNPAFVLTKGTDGEGTRSRSNDRSATIKIHLMQGANGNAVLSALHSLDLLSPNGAGVGAFQVVDQNGTTIYFAEHAEQFIRPHTDRACVDVDGEPPRPDRGKLLGRELLTNSQGG